jgi:hypothetical protein
LSFGFRLAYFQLWIATSQLGMAITYAGRTSSPSMTAVGNVSTTLFSTVTASRSYKFSVSLRHGYLAQYHMSHLGIHWKIMSHRRRQYRKCKRQGQENGKRDAHDGRENIEVIKVRKE